MTGISSGIHRPKRYLLLFFFIALMLPTCTVHLIGILFASNNALLPSSQGLPLLVMKYTMLSERNCNNSFVSTMLRLNGVSLVAFNLVLSSSFDFSSVICCLRIFASVYFSATVSISHGSASVRDKSVSEFSSS